MGSSKKVPSPSHRISRCAHYLYPAPCWPLLCPHTSFLRVFAFAVSTARNALLRITGLKVDLVPGLRIWASGEGLSLGGQFFLQPHSFESLPVQGIHPFLLSPTNSVHFRSVCWLILLSAPLGQLRLRQCCVTNTPDVLKAANTKRSLAFHRGKSMD